jgi:hypothetical protein
MPQSRQKTPGYSAENSLVIFIRGGEPWIMRYCWRTQKCRNLCVSHTFFEGKKLGKLFQGKVLLEL